MRRIKHPNEIVNEFVNDYRGIFGDDLISVILYGSAVTHEYQPGISNISFAVVLTDMSLSRIAQSSPLDRKWEKIGIPVPLFLTPAYLLSSLDTFPIEFLDMQSDYRVLFGEDVLASLEIKKEHLRLHCERRLKLAAVELRRVYVRYGGNERVLEETLNRSLNDLFGVFKALLVMAGETIPSASSDVIAAVEDLYSLGASALSDVFHAGVRSLKGRHHETFEGFARVLSVLIEATDRLPAGDER
jgi:hypothetical protein